MKTIRFIALAVAMLTCGCAMAQETAPVQQVQQTQQTPQFKYGYFSYQQTLESMPGYAVAKRNYEGLKAKYEAEMKRAEDEFNAKYEEFLDGQRDFAPAILKKRQAEIKELMEKNLAFKDESKRLLKQAETEMFAAVKTKLATAVLKVGKERGYAFILNTDSNTAPFINPMIGEDATAFIKEATK